MYTAIPRIAKATVTRPAWIINGNNTNHQDQAMTFVSFNMTNTIPRNGSKPIP